MFMKNLSRGVACSTRAVTEALDMVANQNLGNLDGVESRTFAQIIRHDPEIEAVLHGVVLTNSPDVSRVLANGVDGHRIDIILRLIGDNYSRGFTQDRFGIRGGELFFR